MTTKAEAILKEIENLSKEEFLPIIGPVKGKYLVETVKNHGAKRVLEVGAFIGYSAILMAGALGTDGSIVTIEINPDSAARARENIEKAGLTRRIEVRTGNALSVIPSLPDAFDMVFIDAQKSEYLAYLKLAEAKLKKDGPVFADNVKIFADQMRGYLDYVRNSGKYQSRYIDVGFDGVEISTKLF